VTLPTLLSFILGATVDVMLLAYGARRLLADERDRKVITGWVQLGVLTVLAATAGGMAVALLALRGGPAMTATISLYQFLGYCLLVICALLALRVLAAVFRTGP
jgi:ubiquinone biosynthesis protein